MASQTSLKELSKAITAFVPEPKLPLPEDLIETIAAYLRRHPKYEEAAADRLQEELMSIFDKHVKGNIAASGTWIAILRRLLPMIQTPERILLWLDALKGILTQRTSHEKAIVDETVAGLMDLVALADEYQDIAEGDRSLNPIIHRLLTTWMDKFFPAFVEGVPGMEYNERMFREALVQFGKKRPQQFFASLDSFFVQSKYRKAALRFLCDFIQNRPPHLHQILEGPMFGNLLICLQEDTSTTVISSALTALVMLLPHMPSSLVPHLPVLFNIYARILFWNGERSGATEQPPHNLEPGKGWEVHTDVTGVDDAPVARLANYFTILYGLYPLNFMDYIRKPQRYLRHANVANAEELAVQATELRDQSERFRRCHLLHRNFYTLTVESEKTDFGRWIKSEAAEVVAECMALCLPSDPLDGQDVVAMPGLQIPPVTVEPDKDVSDAALLSSSVALDPRLDALSARANSTSSHQTATRRDSHSSAASNRDLTRVRSRDSARDSQSLVQSPSHTQLQDLIQSNKVIKSSMNQPANESDGPAAPSHRGLMNEQPAGANATQTAFFNSPMSLADINSQVNHLQRQNLMLQNDLSFERYQKQQHIAHIGELRRKQVAEAATEAETQNLIIMNRNLKSRFEEAKKAEMQVRTESEKSRALAKKWEADLSAKLKYLRDQSKETNNELQRVHRELGDARQECDKLRQLVCVGEVKELSWKQNMQSADLHEAEIDRLKAEVERLTVSERDNQAKEVERTAAVESAAAAESRAEALSVKLIAHETELQRARKLFESQAADLQAKPAAAQDKSHGQRASHKPALESLLAGSRAKQAETQKQYDLLMRKYTALQSSLLDMQSGATPEQIKTEASSVPLSGGEYAPRDAAGQAKPKSRTHTLSNSEALEATSYNVTPPLKEQQHVTSSIPEQRPATPSGAEAGPSSVSPDQRPFSRGGVQNRTRKEGKGKQKDEDGPGGGSSSKKEKKSTGLRGIRTGVGEFVRGKTE